MNLLLLRQLVPNLRPLLVPVLVPELCGLVQYDVEGRDANEDFVAATIQGFVILTINLSYSWWAKIRALVPARWIDVYSHSTQ